LVKASAEARSKNYRLHPVYDEDLGSLLVGEVHHLVKQRFSVLRHEGVVINNYFLGLPAEAPPSLVKGVSPFVKGYPQHSSALLGEVKRNL
jgi:hypothetical protein